MIVGEAKATVSAAPAAVFDFVLDLERYRDKRPWRWLAEPLLRRWLQADTAEEMVRFKPLVDQSAPDSSS